MLDSTAENKERPQCGPFWKALQHPDHSPGKLPSLDSVAAASKPLSPFEREWGVLARACGAIDPCGKALRFAGRLDNSGLRIAR